MEADLIDRWFDEYIRVFSACARGELPETDVLGFYSVPLLLTSDAARFQLNSPDDVSGFLHQHIAAMVEAEYDHSVTLKRELQLLNATTALLRGSYSRRRKDETEIARLDVTYVLTVGSATDSLEISVLVIESPQA